MTGEPLIRAGSEADAEALRAIERAAGAPFRALGMDDIADDEPPSAALLSTFAHGGGLWVAERGGGPAAYAMTLPLDCGTHIEQISVHPRHARRGIGRLLLGRIGVRAARDGAPALTLTTFRDVPWNAPYYARIGFRPLPGDALTPDLRRIREDEARAGLDRYPRLCMRRALPRPDCPAGNGS